MNWESANSLLSYFGTTQSQRRLAALMPDYVKVDERSLADLLAFAATYAKDVRYFTEDGRSDDRETGEDLNWEPFFEQDVSVFLALLMGANLQKPDEQIQQAFLKIHQVIADEDHVANLISLIDSLFELTELLSGWYKKAKRLGTWEDEHRIEREIERAFQGDLGEQFWLFYATVTQFSKSPEFINYAGDKPDWQVRFAKLRLGIDERLLRLQSSNSQEKSSEQPITRKKQNTGKGKRRARIDGVLQNLLLTTDQPSEGFKNRIKRFGVRLQEYYRLLYATLAYLQEITPELFHHSIEKKDDHDPGMGLLISFLQLFSHAQNELNAFTENHLNYYYDEVLGRRMKAGIPDRSTVCFQLADNVREHYLKAGTLLFAGINQDGLSSYYQTDTDLRVNQAKVERLSSVFVSKNPLIKTGSSYRLVTALYHAPVANSLDGLGAPLTSPDQTWPLLGEDQFELGKSERRMERSQLGFAIATSTLLLNEGEREVTVDLNFTNESFHTLTDLLEDIADNSEGKLNTADVFNQVFSCPFDLELTGVEEWLTIKKYVIISSEEENLSSPRIRISFLLPPAYPAITAYDEAIHQSGLSTSWPVLKVLLSQDTSLYSYSFLRDLELADITVNVKVKGLKNLRVYNDQSLLDSSSPFVPFGPMPKRNGYFLFGNTELFNKKLNQLSVHLNWADLPDDGFQNYYSGYGKEIDNDSFRCRLSAISDYHFRPKLANEQDEFSLFTTNHALDISLRDTTTLELKEAELNKLGVDPLYQLTKLEEFTNRTRTGYFKLALSNPSMAFGHTLYPRVFAQTMARSAQPKPFPFLSGNGDGDELELPNLPYTPLLNSLKVDYIAKTTINLRQLEKKDNDPLADNKVFRWHPFGREVLYDQQASQPPYLLPRFDQDGYLMIGIRDLHPPETLSLFFDIQESQLKLNRSSIDVTWSFLHNDSWVPFEADQVVSDTTFDLSTSGSVSLYCKANTSKNSKILDPDLHWIRVSANGNLNLIGHCRAVTPQAVNVSWVDNKDENHLATLPELRPRITGLANNNSSIREVTQVRGFYGGKLPETREEYYVRGSERLRHKGRGVSIWDIERLVLEKFPLIHQVKCLGRHGNENIPGAGKVIVVVVPEIDGSSLTPTVGYHVIREIEEYLESVTGAFTKIQVINPVYERVKVNCRIKLAKESERLQGQTWSELHNNLINFICPWLKAGSLNLGGNVTKNEVLAVMNENPRVAFVTAFSLVHVYEDEYDAYHLKDTAAVESNLEIVHATYPWSILVPVDEHQIIFIDQDEYLPPTPTAIDDGMQLETDFIVSSDDDVVTEEGPAVKTITDTDFEIPQSWLGPN